MKKIIPYLAGVVLLAAAAIAVYVMNTPLKYQIFGDNIVLPIISNNYILQELGKPIVTPGPERLKIPDLTQFTHENVIKKLPEDKPATVGVHSFMTLKEMEKFAEPDRVKEFADMQGVPEPRAIVVESGVARMDDIVKAVNDPSLIEHKDGIYYLYAPILVWYGATLVIEGEDGDKLKIRMSQQKGGFLVNAGDTFIIYADISGWNEQKNDYSWYKDKKTFRPFYATWSGSRTYFSRSDFRHLGYSESKSYGITFSIDTDMLKARPHLARPTGWIVESLFEEVYYGFYSFEADDVVLMRNVYKDNIVYGIDPHDRSERLVIAYNEAYGTKQRHGIIVSREVNDSWIVYNYSHNNKGSGFMLDRTSVRNVVAFNKGEHNGSDGLTLFESEENLIVGNDMSRNKKDGIRLRNSWDIECYDNILENNGGVAMQTYASKLVSEHRDFELDPYTQRAGVLVSGGSIKGNKSGGFKFHKFESFKLANINPQDLDDRSFRLDLATFRRELGPLLTTRPHGIEIHKLSKGKKKKDGDAKHGEAKKKHH